MVVIGELPAIEYANNNDSLDARAIETSVVSFAIALKKGSPMIGQINKALSSLKRKGRIEQLQKKWLK